MKKNIQIILPVFCGVYYALLSMIYGGDIYSVDDSANEISVPLNWIILVGTTVFTLCSVFLPMWIKNLKTSHIILAVFSLLLTVYSLYAFISPCIAFFKNGSFSLPLFTVIYAASFCFISVMHLSKAFSGKEDNTLR